MISLMLETLTKKPCYFIRGSGSITSIVQNPGLEKYLKELTSSNNFPDVIQHSHPSIKHIHQGDKLMGFKLLCWELCAAVFASLLRSSHGADEETPCFIARATGSEEFLFISRSIVPYSSNITFSNKNIWKYLKWRVVVVLILIYVSNG